MQSIEDYHKQLLQDISAEALESLLDESDCFFEMGARCLEGAGEIEVADRTKFDAMHGGRRVRVDGVGGDPSESDGILSLIVSDYFENASPFRITATVAAQSFKHLANFLTYSHDDKFRASLPVRSPISDLADLIVSRWDQISRVRLILVTNGQLSARVDAQRAGDILGKDVTFSIWDIARFHRYELSSKERDDLVVNFKEEFGGAVPALLASQTESGFQSYLMVVPGQQLAEIYDKWGARLLEANVRSFLQARGKVNQGIRDTLRREPEMFFSYNNGIAATAEAVETERTSQGIRIVSARNLQIVNGGQTTASVHAALKSSAAGLSNVRVQMKLTVVPSEQSDSVVPKISEYANSQNKVSAADFFSNHPFHVRMEEYSRRLLAPASEGGNRNTKWFYERARGQYLVERSKRTAADRKRFDDEYPKLQLFTKTDLAKVDYTFRCRPDIVSRGAQKNFADFAHEMGRAWAQDEAKISEAWFRAAVSKLIVFRHLEKIVPQQKWYPGGYRANIVTYGIAKLVYDLSKRETVIDLSAVWKDQRVPDCLSESLLAAAKVASAEIVQPPSTNSNITEWSKKSACWDVVRSAQVRYPDCLSKFVLKVGDPKSEGYGRDDARPVKLAGWSRPH